MEGHGEDEGARGLVASDGDVGARREGDLRVLRRRRRTFALAPATGGGDAEGEGGGRGGAMEERGQRSGVTWK